MVAAKVWMWRATSPSVAGRPAEDAGQAGARIAALVGAAQQEVGRERVQEQPRQCPSAVTADAADQPDREPAAAFAPLLPGVCSEVRRGGKGGVSTLSLSCSPEH